MIKVAFLTIKTDRGFQMRVFLSLVGLLAMLSGVAGNAFAGENSGYLGDHYSKLEKKKSASGEEVKRWVSPAFAAGKYTAVMLDKSAFYPKPQPSEQVSADVLQQITDYMDAALLREMGRVLKVVTTPGPNTLRLKPAITAAAAETEGLKAYEMIPLAFVFSQVKKASGNRAKEAKLAVEWLVEDVQSGEVVAAGMREGTGMELDSPEAKVTLNEFKPVLDAWAKDGRTFFEMNKH